MKKKLYWEIFRIRALLIYPSGAYASYTNVHNNNKNKIHNNLEEQAGCPSDRE